MGVIYTIHLHTTLRIIWSEIHPPKNGKVKNNQWPNEGDQPAAFQFQKNYLFCGETCSLRPDPRNPWRWKKCILGRTANLGKREKVSRMWYCSICLCVNDDENLSLILPVLQNLDFEKSTKNLMWFMDTMLKFIIKFQDGSHNSHWNLVVKINIIYVSTAFLRDNPKQVWRSD